MKKCHIGLFNVTKGTRMKGIVMTLFADMVIEQSGMKSWEKILDQSGSEGIFTSGMNYEDEELGKLVQHFSETTSHCPHSVVRKFGSYLGESFQSLYPGYFDGHASLFSFLESVEVVIHVEVKKLYPDASLPKFVYERAGMRTLRMDYLSNRNLCDLAHGLIEDSARHFQTDCTIDHDLCVKRGSDYCSFVIVTKEDQA